jgi:hypothetical protein
MELQDIQVPENWQFQYLIVVCFNFKSQKRLLHHISANCHHRALFFIQLAHLLLYPAAIKIWSFETYSCIAAP